MVRLTDRPDMTLDVYRGCKTTIQQIILHILVICKFAQGAEVGEEEIEEEDDDVIVVQTETPKGKKEVGKL